MATATTMVWEVDAATGSDGNSGGFNALGSNPGTDYTQGAGRTSVAFTGGAALVVDAVTNTKVASSQAFVAADNRNTIWITSGAGWAAGIYEIVAVAGGVATLDRSPAAVGTTGGVGVMGGSLLSPGAAAYRMANGGGTGTPVSGNTMWIKAGTYSITSASVNVAGGCISLLNTTMVDSRVWGYNTTRWDAPTGTNRPLLQLAAGVNSATVVGLAAARTGAAWLRLDGNGNVNGSGGAGNTSGVGILTSTNGHQLTSHISYTRFATLGYNASGTQAMASYSDASYCGVGFGSSTEVLFACVAHHCTTGFSTNAQYSGPVMCLSYANTGDGFSVGSQAVIAMCTAYGNGGNGFTVADPRSCRILHCVAYGNTTASYKITASAGTTLDWLVNCAGDTAPVALTHQSTAVILGYITLTANPFVNAAGGDFSLNNVAGGGLALRNVDLPNIPNSSYPDLGFTQRREQTAAMIM